MLCAANTDRNITRDVAAAESLRDYVVAKLRAGGRTEPALRHAALSVPHERNSAARHLDD